MINGKQVLNSSILKSKLNLVTPTSANDPATKQYVDDQLNNSLMAQDWKASVRVATTANINLASAPATIDGVTLAATNRVLVKNQTTGSQNGIYIFNAAGAAMTRSSDANTNAAVTAGLATSVEEGTANAKTTFRLATPGLITLDTTALVFEQFATFTAPAWVVANKNMAALVTVSDNDLACSTAIAGTPAGDGFVDVQVNGLSETLGDGVKTASCYFSGDSGATARSIAAITVGDRLYWVGSLAGYQLETSDKINFVYEV